MGNKSCLWEANVFLPSLDMINSLVKLRFILPDYSPKYATHVHSVLHVFSILSLTVVTVISIFSSTVPSLRLILLDEITERERERERQRQTDRQTERERQTGRQREREQKGQRDTGMQKDR